MTKWIVAIVVTGCATLAGAQGTGQTKQAPPPPTPPQQQDQGQPAHPRRVLAKLDGFDMAPARVTANQIGGASRGSGKKLALYAPHKAKIYTLTPSFSWKGDPAEGYKFHIQEITGTFSWDRDVTGTSLAYPADAPPLSPGGTYLWKVVPVSPLLGPPPPAAMILVLGGPEREQLDTAIGQLQGTGFDLDMARARLFFNQRLWYDAVMTCSDLIAKFPNRSDLHEMRALLYYQLPETEALADADLSRPN